MGVKSPYFEGTGIEKPREKALRLGFSSLSDTELVALLLCTGDKNENVLELSERLLYEKGGLKGLFTSLTPIETNGIKKAKSARLGAVTEILRRLPFAEEKIKIESAEEAIKRSKAFFYGRKEEIALVLYLDRKKELEKRSAFSSLSEDSLFLPIDKILQEALLCKAKFLLVLHNHPSGHLLPSEADIRTNKELSHSASLAGILLLDSLILGEDGYYSSRGEKVFSYPSSQPLSSDQKDPVKETKEP